jgi:hypothetical protein
VDFQTILIVASGVGTSIVGWFVREIKKDLDEAAISHKANSLAINALQLDVAKNYVTHADLSDIKASLRRIEDKLDDKADK